MMKFFIFLTVMGGLALYVSARFFAHSPWPEISRGWIIFAAATIVSLQLIAFKSTFLHSVSYTNPYGAFFVNTLAWVAYVGIGMFYCAILFTLFTDIVVLIWGALSPTTSLAVLHRSAFIVLVTMTLASTVVGIFHAATGLKVVEVKVPITDLPTAFEGYNIVQISDLHVGALIHRAYVEKVVKKVDALDADMIVLTGDMSDGFAEQLKYAMLPLAGMKAKDGIFFVTGNHEYYWPTQGWLDPYQEMKITSLLTEHRLIRKGNDSLAIAGIVDRTQGPTLSDPAAAIKGAPEKAVKILLAHQPNDYARAAQAGFDLQLSGHTHGGQFFPWNLVVRFFHRYFVGLNKHEGMQIYINRGTGYWGTPLRGFVPPEITLLTLTRA